jgi:hypothetical protein
METRFLECTITRDNVSAEDMTKTFTKEIMQHKKFISKKKEKKRTYLVM